MHPVIRIVTFIVFSLGVVFGNVQHLLLALLLLVTGYAVWHPHLLPMNWRMLRRMRWLFLSILVIYLWFTPGELLFPVIGSWSPSWEGLRLGSYRIFTLVFIVFAVNLMIRSIERDELIGGILWLLHPLHFIGLPNERLAVRIALTFDVVQEVQGMYGAPNNDQNASKKDPDQQNIQPVQAKSLVTKIRARLWSIGASAVQLFENIIQRAENTPCHDVVINEEGAPPHYQWVYPMVLALLCFWLHSVRVW